MQNGNYIDTSEDEDKMNANSDSENSDDENGMRFEKRS